mgnify:FL=1
MFFVVRNLFEVCICCSLEVVLLSIFLTTTNYLCVVEMCLLHTIMAPGAESRVDSSIHWINHYPLNASIGFLCTCPVHMDDDSSGRLHYPVFSNWGQDAIFTKGGHFFFRKSRLFV